jgi:DNA-binding transcriptional MerR regulator/methylmalonyl-CoA mutase cobalamin-binding subunit
MSGMAVVDERDGRREPRHPIQVVSRRTGLTPDVIRVWERRYGAVTPVRSGTNRRLYSDGDLEKLVLLRRATLAGRAIGHVARLEIDELRSLVEADEAAFHSRPGGSSGKGQREAGSVASRLEASLAAVRALDAARLRSVLTSAAVEMGAQSLMQDLLVPLLTTVGEEWHRGSMRIHHEHLTTSHVRSLLESLREGGARSLAGPDLIVATLAGEQHELGALMAAVVAGSEGWCVTFLGCDLPVDEIAGAVRQRAAKAIALSLVHRDRGEHAAHELIKLRRLIPPDVAVLVGGQAALGCESALQEIGAIRIGDMARFRTELQRLRDSIS